MLLKSKKWNSLKSWILSKGKDQKSKCISWSAKGGPKNGTLTLKCKFEWSTILNLQSYETSILSYKRHYKRPPWIQSVYSRLNTKERGEINYFYTNGQVLNACGKILDSHYPNIVCKVVKRKQRS